MFYPLCYCSIFRNHCSSPSLLPHLTPHSCCSNHCFTLNQLSEADPLFLEIAKEKYDKPRSEWYHFLNIVTGFIEDQDLLNKCINNIKDEVMSQHIKDKYEEVKEQ